MSGVGRGRTGKAACFRTKNHRTGGSSLEQVPNYIKIFYRFYLKGCLTSLSRASLSYKGHHTIAHTWLLILHLSLLRALSWVKRKGLYLSRLGGPSSTHRVLSLTSCESNVKKNPPLLPHAKAQVSPGHGRCHMGYDAAVYRWIRGLGAGQIFY
jgi:hypothetical protein